MNIYKNILGGFLSLAIIFSTLSVGVVSVSADNTFGQSVAESHKPVCPGGGQQEHDGARCHARVVADKNGAPVKSTKPNGLSPQDLHTAYTATITTSKKQIIAIVDAYDHPTIASDLTTYSKQFNLPILPVCSGPVAASAFPCFSKIDQRGGTAYPLANAGWALEIAMDVEVAHAMCQNCSILLVEADDNGFNALAEAVDQAVAQGATVISNSWGAGEFSTQSTFNAHFNHPGIAIVASSGDSGYGVQYPAASPYVTSVGGTTLTIKNSSQVNEVAWSGAGSGCSAYEVKPSWQHDTGCINRTVADVSAVADPATGAAVYNSVKYSGQTGWFKVGGTSLAAPIIAGVYALAADVPTTVQAASLPYTKYSLSTLRDIVSGSNGVCNPTYLCSGVTGFDGPTGLGTPKGLGAF